MMADSNVRPGNPDRGWNDPPMFSFNPLGGTQHGSPRKNLLNKRVAYPQGAPKVPGVAQQVPTLPPGMPPPLSPVLLPPTSDTSTPTPVPILVPTIIMPASPPSGATQSGLADERLEDLMDRLHLNGDEELLEYTSDILDKVFNTHQAKIQEKACDDIQKKLLLFKERWKGGSMTKAVRCKVAVLAIALNDEDLDKANRHHLALMVDHTAEVNQWMVAIKRLIQEVQKAKEKVQDKNSGVAEEAPPADCPLPQSFEGETTTQISEKMQASEIPAHDPAVDSLCPSERYSSTEQTAAS